jgi:hypothetical protein
VSVQVSDLEARRVELGTCTLPTIRGSGHVPRPQRVFGKWPIIAHTRWRSVHRSYLSRTEGFVGTELTKANWLREEL